MHRRLILAAVAVAAIAVIGVGLTVAIAATPDDDTSTETTSGLGIRKVTAGEIDITIEPLQLDERGASFAISLDTHSAELSMDLASGAELDVAGAAWPGAAWEGDGPGGHHRSGELRFEPGGPVTGTAQLTLAGFSDPIDVAWDLEAGS